MKVLDVLVKAKELIQKPENWMKGDYSNADLTCFCSLGAVAMVMELHDEGDSDNQPAAKLLHKAVASEIPLGYSFATYNDNHTHDEVMAAFDKAIELAKVETV